VLDGRQAAEILNRPTMPSGSVHLSGSLHYQSATNRSQIESLMIDGGVTSASLTWNTPAVHARLAKLSAHYSLANGNAVVRDARAEVLGGAVMANGTMAELGGNTHSVFHVELKNVSLAQAVQAFQQTAPRSQVSLNGAANATATVTWGKTINDLNGRADLILNGQAAGNGGRNFNRKQIGKGGCNGSNTRHASRNLLEREPRADAQQQLSSQCAIECLDERDDQPTVQSRPATAGE
jgi:hypothetical protein